MLLIISIRNLLYMNLLQLIFLETSLNLLAYSLDL
jgi:hypothetical protein